MSSPACSMWGPASQLGGSLNYLKGSTSRRANSTYTAVFNLLTNVAY
jgi:hypothetical protein